MRFTSTDIDEDAIDAIIHDIQSAEGYLPNHGRCGCVLCEVSNSLMRARILVEKYSLAKQFKRTK
jgi:hypothetical protein